jgi:hypothetical protein
MGKQLLRCLCAEDIAKQRNTKKLEREANAEGLWRGAGEERRKLSTSYPQRTTLPRTQFNICENECQEKNAIKPKKMKESNRGEKEET